MDSTEKQYIMDIIYQHLLKTDPVYAGFEFGRPAGVSYYIEIQVDDRSYRFRGTNMDPHDNRLPKVDKDIEAIVEAMSVPEDVKKILRDDVDTGC